MHAAFAKRHTLVTVRGSTNLNCPRFIARRAAIKIVAAPPSLAGLRSTPDLWLARRLSSTRFLLRSAETVLQPTSSNLYPRALCRVSLFSDLKTTTHAP